MKRIQSFYKMLSFTEKSAPLAFLVICTLSFGLLIPGLGFFMDDWPYVFYAKVKGIDSLREMLLFDSRPNAAWLYMLGFRLFGVNPLAWHISSLLMRLSTVIAFWAFLRLMWNGRKKEVIYISLLFAIYPFFMLQPFAVGSTHHWFGFLTFNLSLILMALAVQTTSYKKWLFIVPALVLEAAHLFTSEYFAGLELIRVVILWILVSRTEPIFFKKSMLVILNWLPYLIVLGMFFYWRVFVYENPPPMTRNEPVILMQLFSEPFKAIGFLFSAFATDTISVMTIGWQKAIDPSLLNFSSSFVKFKIAICALGFALAFIYLKSLLPDQEEPGNDDWKTGSISLAIATLATGGLPIWFIGRSIVESKNLLSASRFGIPSMFGAALMTFLLLNYFITDKNKKLLLIALMLTLAINFHLDNTKTFLYSWEKQERFAQQLIWRAPQIEPGTSILTDEEILGIMGEYAVSFSINIAYQVENVEHTPPYWYFPFYYTNPNINDLLQGVPLEYTRLSMNFKGNSNKMLLLDFNPELNRCLWVMQPQDINLRLVSEDMRHLSAGSDIDLIKQSNGAEPSLPESIYGKQDNQTWCYYFEKADLARQYKQWDVVVQLWEESQSAGERADNGFEYIPFIEGFGHFENWEQMQLLTKLAKRITSGLEPSLCSALDRIAANTPASQQRDTSIQGAKNDLKCENFQ